MTTKSFRGACVTAAVVLILFSAIDWASAVWPFLPGDVGWRFGAIGAASGSTLTPMLGLLLLFGAAQLGAGRRTYLLLATVAASMVLLLTASAGVFVLDALQLRASLQPTANSAFEVTAVKTLTKLAIAAFAGLVFGVLCVQAWRQTGSASRATVRESPKVEAKVPPARERAGSLLIR